MSKKASRKKSGKSGRSWWRVEKVVRDSLVQFLRGDSLMISGSIAYHSLLAVFPLLLLLLEFCGIYIQHYELSGRLALVLDRYIPIKTDFIMRTLVTISRSYGRVSLVSFVLLLWSSSGVFLPVEKALDRSWEVEKGRRWWRSRLLALEMALIVGFLILLSSAVVGVNIFIHSWLRQRVIPIYLPFVEFAYHIAILVTTFSMTLLMFIILFERLPNRRLSLREIFPSALLTALFWEATRSLFTLLLPFFNYRQVYGSIGVVVALMTWAYASSAVMLFGAQVSRALYRTLREIESESAEGRFFVESAEKTR
jgi:membrane protein